MYLQYRIGTSFLSIKKNISPHIVKFFSTIKNNSVNCNNLTTNSMVNRSSRLPIDQIKLVDFSISYTDLDIEANLPLKTNNLSNLNYGNTNNNVYRRHDCVSTNLDDSILSVVKSITPDYSVFNTQLAELSSYLVQRLKPILGPDASYHYYGSTCTRLYTFNSDIDLSINLPTSKSRQAQIKLLRKIGEYLKRIYPQRNVEERFTARIPLIHWSSNTANARSSVDICINNHLGVVNSSMVAAYMDIDDRVKILAIALKKWAKSRDINDKSKGTLSSFALVLMVIHYLQKISSPPILPYLQDIAVSHNLVPNFINGFDCRFADRQLLKRELSEMHENYGINKQSVGQILLDLFKYYSLRTCDSSIISINQLGHFKSELSDGLSFRYFVENPFEPGIDVANIPFNMESKINYEFTRAYNILQSGAIYNAIL